MGGIKKDKIISHAEALALVLKSVRKVGVEKTSFKKALGRVLRGPIKADRQLPPFDRSAMDGYAARVSDFKSGRASLRCVGSLEAGAGFWPETLKKGEALKIMTGAPAPAGADAVVKVENSKRAGETVFLLDPKISKWSNIHRKGSDAKRGRTLVEAGTLLNPLHAAVSASVGATTLTVSRKIKVRVISTGTELVAPERNPKPYQIRDANSSHLLSRLTLSGLVEAGLGGRFSDDPKALTAGLKNAIKNNDLVIISGGVSMGDSDHTSSVLRGLGVRKIFHKCAVRPGKPVWFGVKGGCFVFGLPGNPVSIAVAFFEFVLPALRKMAGMANPNPRSIRLILSSDVRKGNSLTEFRVARITPDGRVEALKGYGGSGDFVSAGRSDGVIVMPEEAKEIKGGSEAEFHPWEF